MPKRKTPVKELTTFFSTYIWHQCCTSTRHKYIWTRKNVSLLPNPPHPARCVACRVLAPAPQLKGGWHRHSAATAKARRELASSGTETFGIQVSFVCECRQVLCQRCRYSMIPGTACIICVIARCTACCCLYYLVYRYVQQSLWCAGCVLIVVFTSWPHLTVLSVSCT